MSGWGTTLLVDSTVNSHCSDKRDFLRKGVNSCEQIIETRLAHVCIDLIITKTSLKDPWRTSASLFFSMTLDHTSFSLAKNGQRNENTYQFMLFVRNLQSVIGFKRPVKRTKKLQTEADCASCMHATAFPLPWHLLLKFQWQEHVCCTKYFSFSSQVKNYSRLSHSRP